MASNSTSGSNYGFLYTTHNQPHSPPPPPPPPMPSCSPIQLSGFLDGNTIQVQGDTDDLQFSVHFSIHTKHNPDNGSPFPGAGTVTPEKQTFNPLVVTHEEEELNVNANENANTDTILYDQVPTEIVTGRSGSSTVVTTRLKSGVLSPVNYYPRRRGNLQLWRKVKGRDSNVLERVLRKHSFPIRPCSSYSFFVMVNWGLVNSSSFREKSKILGEMWRTLPQSEKQVFKEMAMKDNARYKRQCMLLMGRGLRRR